MPAKIFINYRRDDVPGDARGVRDGLAAKFGKSNVFMDVDNLIVGQRFASELAKALDACDVLIAIIGPRWMEHLKGRLASGERDYVREEIAAALKRNIVVIPVRVGREGSMPALPRADELPEDISDLVDFQKHDVAHERFRRDIDDLIQGIVAVRRSMASGDRPRPVRSARWALIGSSVAATMAIGYAGVYSGMPMPWPWGSSVSEATIQAEVDDTILTITSRLDAVRVQLDSVVTWSDGQMLREESTGGSCGVPSGAGRGPLYNARRSVRDSINTLRDGISKSWLEPTQADLKALREAADLPDTGTVEARAADIRGRARSIAARSNELGKTTAVEMRALATAVAIQPNVTGFSCYDPTLANRLRQAADHAVLPAVLKPRP